METNEKKPKRPRIGENRVASADSQEYTRSDNAGTTPAADNGSHGEASAERTHSEYNQGNYQQRPYGNRQGGYNRYDNNQGGYRQGGYQQRPRFVGTGRRGMPLDIFGEHVDGAVESPAAQLVLQLGVIEQGVLGDDGVEPLVVGHGERLHGTLLVAGPQITVGQMVRRILRERVLGAARLAQPLSGLGITGGTVERETHERTPAWALSPPTPPRRSGTERRANSSPRPTTYW